MSKLESVGSIFKTLQDIDSRLQSLERAISPIEAWNEIGGINSPQFMNGWENYNTVANSTAAFYKSPFETVHIKGLIKNGSLGDEAFVVPYDYAPLTDIIVCVLTNTGIGELRISSNGNVKPVSGGTTWFSLDNVSYRAS